MATDDERRRVAERLRRMVAVGLPPWVGYTYDAVMGYMPLVGQDSAYHESSYREYCLRLADLIDPCDASHSCRDTVACDREALLALADKARKLGDEENGPASFAVRCTFRVFARSIYKALGEAAE